MLDSFLLLWQQPWLRVCCSLYGVLLAASVVSFIRHRRATAAGSCPAARRWQVALCLALCFTPGAITDFLAAGFIGPASAGLLFALPMLWSAGQPMRALWTLGFFYLLPLATAFALFYVAYPWYSRLGLPRNAARV